MAVTFYVDVATKSVISVKPDMTTKVMISIDIPSGVPIPLLINQISAFMAGVAAEPLPAVLEVNLLDPVIPVPAPAPDPAPAPAPDPDPAPAPDPDPAPNP